MAIILNDNVQLNIGKPVENKYLEPLLNAPYTGVSQVNSTIIEGLRFTGLTVNVSGEEYWYENGTGDGDLVIKTGGGASTNVTGATNGVQLIDGNVELGGTLTGDTFINSNGNNFGFGSNTISTGFNSFAEGFNTCAISGVAHAEGQFTRAFQSSHAEGNNSHACGGTSHAEGIATCAIGDYSHSEGFCTTAIGRSSHSQGCRTTAIGCSSHAEGICTNAFGLSSHAGGNGVLSREVSACGSSSFNHSNNTFSQTSGFGANADRSVILGGQNNHIESGNTGAAIIGGDFIKLTGTSYINNTIVENLTIWTPPTNDPDGEILVWDSATNKIGKTTVSSLGGLTGSSNGLSTSGNDVILGGALTQNTTIEGGTYSLDFQNLSNSELSVTGASAVLDLNAKTNAQLVIKSQSGTLVADSFTNAVGFNLDYNANIFSVTDNRSTAAGLQYVSDYSLDYTDRSLVDKAYVDAIASGLDAKDASIVATTTGDGNIDLSGGTFVSGSTLDGVVVQDTWRVLIKNQTDAAENGIYDYSESASGFTRSSDFDGNPTGEVSQGSFTFIVTGDTLSSTSWLVTTPDPITVGTTDINFTIASRSFDLSDGTGTTITIVGSNRSVSVELATSSGLDFDAGGTAGRLRVASSIAGQGITLASGVLNVNLTDATLVGDTGVNVKIDTSGADILYLDNLDISIALAGAGDSSTFNNWGAGVGYTSTGKLSVSGNEVAFALAGAGDSSTFTSWCGNLGYDANDQLVVDGYNLASQIAPTGTGTFTSWCGNLGYDSTGIIKVDGYNIAQQIAPTGTGAFTSWCGNLGYDANGIIKVDGYDIAQQIAPTGTGAFTSWCGNLGYDSTGIIKVDGYSIASQIVGSSGAFTSCLNAIGYTANGTLVLDEAAIAGAVTGSTVNGADNGLTVTSNIVCLGGTLNQNTTIDGGGTYSASFNDLLVFSASTGNGTFGLYNNTATLDSTNIQITGSTGANIYGNSSKLKLNTTAIELSSYSPSTPINLIVGTLYTVGSRSEINLTNSGTIITGYNTGSLSSSVMTLLGTHINISGTSASIFEGIQYETDYSGCFTNRSLVDKEYVDGQITGSSVTANNGLTKVGNNIELGGTLSENKTIDGGGMYGLTISGGQFSANTSNSNFSLTANVNLDTSNNITISGGGTTNLYSNSTKLSLNNNCVDLQTYASNSPINIIVGTSQTGYTQSSINITDNGTIIKGYDGGQISQTTMTIEGHQIVISGDSAGSPDTSMIGIIYNDDWSANFTNRTLVDKEYVDNKVSGSTDTYVSGASMNVNTLELGRTEGQSDVTVDLSQFSTTASNGITKIGSNFVLGGILTGDTQIDTTSGYSITFGTSTGATGATYYNHLAVDNLAIMSTPAVGTTSDSVLVRNSTSGIVKTVAGSELGDANNVYDITGITSSTLTTAEYVVLVQTSGATQTVTLPASPVNGQAYKIKDKGNALTNAITVSGNGNNIDGAANATINTDYGALELVYSLSDTEWYTLAFIN